MNELTMNITYYKYISEYLHKILTYCNKKYICIFD